MTAPRQPASGRANFRLIITDQQCWDHLGASGKHILRTPHIDAIAARGWLAERFHVASPACMRTQANLLKTVRRPAFSAGRSA